ncbi:hypothetical protein [Flavisphingomonas formosensis]|uniref:hypothetical protein n=1 Tax=Flavisphingomonas formosensis TaxID=861534 RepID=UPI0012F77BC9|nr:hypothetical protein [Sphingomonas formosensis]
MIEIGSALGARLWSWIAPHWMTILAAIGAAGLITWLALGRAELQAFADRSCATAGAPYAAGPDACETRILALATYERDTQAATARALAAAAAERESKAAADARAAQANDAAARSAADTMEKEDAKIGPDGRVDGDWLAALNRAGGLRAPAR